MSQSFELVLNAAFSAYQSRDLIRAEKLYAQAYKMFPNHFGLLMLYSALAAEQGLPEKVIELLRKALKINPKEFHAQFNIAVAYEAIGNFAKAIEHYGHAIRLDNFQELPYKNRAGLFALTEKYDEAKNDYEVILSRNPADPLYLNAYGKILYQLKDYEASASAFQKAIIASPNSAEMHFNLANTFQALNKLDLAEAEFNKTVDLDSNFGDAYKNLGNLYWDVKKMSQAIDCFEKAIAINGDNDLYTQGSYLMAKNYICDWVGYQERLTAFEKSALNGGKRLSMPGVSTWVSGSGEVMRKLADQWVLEYQQLKKKIKFRKISPRKKIKIGYFSPDFRTHALSSLVVEMMELHDHSKFEIYAFSFINTVDGMQARIKSAVDYFIDVSNLSNEEVITIAEKEEIDIAIDLAGYTTGNRWDIFLNRVAPIQVNYLGYPGTLGGNFMDYIVADKVIIPEESQKYYSEKIVYMPDSYQPNDTQKQISSKQLSREEFGLPGNGIVLCCFNNSFKITPEVFEVWMRLLKQSEGSVLWLLSENHSVIENLKNAAKSHGVLEDRIIFAKNMPLAEHLARQRLADIFLDTIPYNAHTTGSEALWAGVPVVTLAGEVFASRVGASLLTALGMPELITYSLKDYENLILRLMKNPQELEAIKLKINGLKTSSPLFDTRRYVKNIESAYQIMFDSCLKGKKPDHIIL